jgi:ketosteroid isomerase-like protein
VSKTFDLVALARLPYEAISKGDFDAAMSVYGPDTVFETPVGVLHGSAAIREFYEDWIAQFEDFEIVLEECQDLGNGVTIAIALLRGRPANSEMVVEGRWASIGTWKDGLLERVRPQTDIAEGRAEAERLVNERE